VDQRVTWIGTSMGGLIGLFLAASPNSPVERLVLNDIGANVGKDERFHSLEDAERFFEAIYGVAWGPHFRGAHLSHLTSHGVQFDQDKKNFRLAYDPDIRVPMVKAGKLTADMDLFPVWAKIACPVLLIRGEKSDLLSRDTANKMVSTHRGGGCSVVEVAGAAHAPGLVGPEVDELLKWIGKNSVVS